MAEKDVSDARNTYIDWCGEAMRLRMLENGTEFFISVEQTYHKTHKTDTYT